MVLILLVIKRVHSLALPVERGHVLVDILSPVPLALSTPSNLLSIEVRHAFSTDDPGHHILMSINHCKNPVLPQLVNQVFDLLQVCLIVDPGLDLDGFPHDPQPDEIHAPFPEILDVKLNETVLGVKFGIPSGWDVGGGLVDYVDSVQGQLATIDVTEDSVV